MNHALRCPGRRPGFVTGVFLLSLALGLAGCKQGAGDRCEVDSDCDSGLTCQNLICTSPCATGTIPTAATGGASGTGGSGAGGAAGAGAGGAAGSAEGGAGGDAAGAGGDSGAAGGVGGAS